MAKAKLTVKSNGSVLVEGDFELLDADGNSYGLAGRNKISLCRCGLSTTKPFCDGSHRGKLDHVAEAYDLPPAK